MSPSAVLLAAAAAAAAAAALVPAAGVEATCGPWVPVNVTTLAKAHASDVLDVYYLVAPLLECSEGDYLSYAHAYHAGLAFRNRRTGDEVTVNYDASPSFTGAIMPKFVKTSKGTEMVWQNTGAIFLYHAPINFTYWETTATVVGEITGDGYNKFMFDFIAKGNKTNEFYNIWSVFSSRDETTRYLAAHECFDFVWQCWAELARLGHPIKPTTLKQSFVSLYAKSKPTLVDQKNPTEMKATLAWYEKFVADLTAKGKTGFLEALWEILWDEVFYVRSSNDYYLLSLHWPYAEIHFVDVAVPKK